MRFKWQHESNRMNLDFCAMMATVADSKSTSRTSDWPTWKSRSAGVQDPAPSRRSVSFHSTVNIFTWYIFITLYTQHEYQFRHGLLPTWPKLTLVPIWPKPLPPSKDVPIWLTSKDTRYVLDLWPQTKLIITPSRVAALTSIMFSWWDSSKLETESSTKKSENCESRNKSLFDTFDPAVLWLAEFKAPSRD